MQRKRYINFAIAILVGVVAGMLYGWFVRPVKSQEVAINTLREDYKTDYALMVAEIYQVEQDIHLAISRLAYLGDDPSHEIMNTALESAREMNYNKEDLEIMATLRKNLADYQQVDLPTTEGEADNGE